VKADRLPRWAFARLNAEQKEAYNALRWYAPGPAERARLKLILRWKRTRDESLALALEMLAAGRSRKAVADELGVTDRHLRRLLAETGSETPEKRPANPVPMRPSADTTCEIGIGHQPRPTRGPMGGFASFADLDQWLEGDA